MGGREGAHASLAGFPHNRVLDFQHHTCCSRMPVNPDRRSHTKHQPSDDPSAERQMSLKPGTMKGAHTHHTGGEAATEFLMGSRSPAKFKGKSRTEPYAWGTYDGVSVEDKVMPLFGLL